MLEYTKSNVFEISDPILDSLDFDKYWDFSSDAEFDERAFIAAANDCAFDFPLEIRRRLQRFSDEEDNNGFLIVRGYHVNPDELTKTPGHWSKMPNCEVTRRFMFWQTAVSRCLGQQFGWATKQNGQIIHQILPIAGDEGKQLSSGSGVELSWHVEDGPDQERADFIILGCLRNPTFVPTKLAVASHLELEADAYGLLSEHAFDLAVDVSHAQANNPSISDRSFPSADAAADTTNFRTVPVLLGNDDHKYLIFDPEYMSHGKTPEHRKALERMTDEIEKQKLEIALHPGDVLVIDNFRTVHGRSKYEARFDGYDRWLVRTMVKKSLRNMRGRESEKPNVFFSDY